MSAYARRLLVGVLIGLYFIWPFVHQQLVLRYRLNPWKLAGWAMYSTVPPRINLQIVGLYAAGKRVTLDKRATPELAAEVQAYLARRQWLGLFADPAPVGRALSRAYPEHARFVLIVDEFGLTKDDQLGLTQRVEYGYRSGRGAGRRDGAK